MDVDSKTEEDGFWRRLWIGMGVFVPRVCSAEGLVLVEPDGNERILASDDGPGRFRSGGASVLARVPLAEDGSVMGCLEDSSIRIGGRVLEFVLESPESLMKCPTTVAMRFAG